jgi:hypothetical protein
VQGRANTRIAVDEPDGVVYEGKPAKGSALRLATPRPVAIEHETDGFDLELDAAAKTASANHTIPLVLLLQEW